MTKLNQIIAVEKQVKATAYSALTKAHQMLGKPQLLSGISRTYTPEDDEGERFPAELSIVQLTVDSAIAEVKTQLTKLFDVVATKDYGNSRAKANVVVDGYTLLTDVPVPYLLFLEKQLTDLSTFVRKLPILDPSESWTWDEQRRVYYSSPVQTKKTKRINTVVVKWSPPTPEYSQPAQTELVPEDRSIGTWNTVKFSGAISPDQAKKFMERVEKLTRAVKFAREEANSLDVDDVRTGQAILDYLFD